MDKLNNDRQPEVTHERIAFAQKTDADINPDLEKLRQYTHSKLALAGQLRIVREELSSLGLEKNEQLCGELMVKLAEDRFTLAVLGQFKRGKSSLMNAIIGRELLPTGVLPLTSAITVLKYGPTERLVVTRADVLFPEELPISSLSGYVTEKGNPANQKKVQTATVELPVPFLRQGIEFVDTPGVGSAIVANSATTYSFLPQCDAVLFVTSVDTPMTSLELEFLKEIRQYVDRIFFVINKIDLVNESELAEILAFVSETIRIQIGSDTVNIFPVSARKALGARLSCDVVLYEQSGLKSLEEALASFLSSEKSATFLSAVAQKAMRVVDDETAQNAFGEAALQARANVMKQKDFVTLRRDPHISAEAIMHARLKLEALYKSNIEGKWAEENKPELLQPVATETIPEAKSTFPASMAAAAGLEADTATDMEADMLTRDCPVCHHITEVASDFFSQWQYHIAAEEHAQAEFAEELGFCPLHTWQLLAKSSPHGASIGFAPLAEEVARQIRKFHEEPVMGDKVKQLVHNSRNCRVCELLRGTEMEYIQKIAAMLNDSEGRNTYLLSQGACLRHLGMLMDTVSTDGIREFLLSDAARHFQEDAVDMRSYSMKREALRRSLQNSNEVDAYRRAIIRMVGGKGVYVPWAEDG
jgi:GTPase Era involved in 16S rRNA processing